MRSLYVKCWEYTWVSEVYNYMRDVYERNIMYYKGLFEMYHYYERFIRDRVKKGLYSESLSVDLGYLSSNGRKNCNCLHGPCTKEVLR